MTPVFVPEGLQQLYTGNLSPSFHHVSKRSEFGGGIDVNRGVISCSSRAVMKARQRSKRSAERRFPCAAGCGLNDESVAFGE